MSIRPVEAREYTLGESLPVELRRETGRKRWMRSYLRRVVVADTLAVYLAAFIATLWRFGDEAGMLRVDARSISYVYVVAVAVPAWLLVLALGGAYETRRLGTGSEEFRRVLHAAVYFVAGLSTVAFAAKLNLSRGFVAGTVPLAICLTLIGRLVNRRWLRLQRVKGLATRQVLVVGLPASVAALTHHFSRYSWFGYRVAGACVPPGCSQEPVPVITNDRTEVPVFGSTDAIPEALTATGADVLAVADSEGLGEGGLRALAWQLEGSGVDLVVAPAMTDVAGPRVVIRPVSGLPLLHVEEPKLSGPARVFKECFDRFLAALGLLLLSPLLVVVAIAVKVTSKGPVLFRQIRVGRGGRHFTVLKFRTMRDGAEREQQLLEALNEHDGLLFKIRRDPRVTPLGRWLRRYSIDELPQLVNVLRGDMSLVGPRPPLVTEVERYEFDAERRLLVKPGLTGLWQVSGRSDLSWNEGIRLDLYYIDNWSPAFDLVILCKTAAAIVAGNGAY